MEPVAIATVVLDMMTDTRIKLVRFNRRMNVALGCDRGYKFDGVNWTATRALFGLHAHPGLNLHNNYTRTPVFRSRPVGSWCIWMGEKHCHW